MAGAWRGLSRLVDVPLNVLDTDKPRLFGDMKCKCLFRLPVHCLLLESFNNALPEL
jgi:hypothetical protein